MLNINDFDDNKFVSKNKKSRSVFNVFDILYILSYFFIVLKFVMCL